MHTSSAEVNESDSQPIMDKSGWSALPTITTFDRGKTYSHNWMKESAVVSTRLTAFTPSSVFVESLVEQLCKLFEKDPLSQKKLYVLICQKLYDMKLIDKTYKLEEFQFMRNYYQRALYHLLTVSNSPTIDRKLESFLNQSPSHLSLPPAINPGIFDRSRYQDEFEEIEFIARGGFGRVFRVRNKIDGCEYAVKKICIRYHGDEQFLRSLREVRTLAKLDHHNIVAYKAAWFEALTGVVATEDCLSGSNLECLDPEPHEESSLSRRGDELEDDSGGIVFATGDGGASGGVFHQVPTYSPSGESVPLAVGSESSSTSPSAAQRTDSGGKGGLKYDGSLCDHSSGSSNKACRGQKQMQGAMWAVLHIQMQLYQESLRAWLDLRNDALQHQQESSCGAVVLGGDGVTTALHIFLGILGGVEYMQAMGVVHHDLKPSNIFVEGFSFMPSGSAPVGLRQVRVGDFGLACHRLAPYSPGTNVVDDHALWSPGAVVPTDSAGGGSCLVQVQCGDALEGGKEGIGTHLYAAPEQLEGHCNSMSDTFSLAIILFELLQPFFTTMERVKVISALRSTGNVPDDFQITHPSLASLIKEMLSPNPSSRPSVEEINEVLHSVLPVYESRVLQSRDVCIHADQSEWAGGGSVRCSVCLSGGWEEEVALEGGDCGSVRCGGVRALQGRTIRKLREDLWKRDKLIEQLKGRIRQLESSIHCGTEEEFEGKPPSCS